MPRVWLAIGKPSANATGELSSMAFPGGGECAAHTAARRSMAGVGCNRRQPYCTDPPARAAQYGFAYCALHESYDLPAVTLSRSQALN